MIEVNTEDSVNERVLWHGTTAEAAENIIMFGFNRSYAGAHGKNHKMSILCHSDTVNTID